MWVYAQDSGKLLHNGVIIGIGYAGRGEGKNNHEMQDVRNVGPLPCGFYIAEDPVDHPELGPLAIPLTPDPQNEMFGRSDFWCHGDSETEPGNASKGCMVQPRAARVTWIGSKDRLLQVIPTLENWPNAPEIGISA